jgi:hypothetical protein
MVDHRHRLGDQPIQEEQRENMNKIARLLDHTFNGEAANATILSREDNRKWGFVLLVFPFGEEEGGRCNFISNGSDRKDLVVLFKEMIARFEGQPEMKGRA